MSPATAPDAMRETNRIFEAAIRARDFAALERVYTADARILPPGAPMIAGRDSIIEFWRQAVAQLGVTDCALKTVEMDLRDGLIAEIGAGTLTLAGSPEPAVAKYVVVWQQEDGVWKWHIDIWNMNA